jgi:RNA polymerase sigma-70 factor (ECF subfamily)
MMGRRSSRGGAHGDLFASAKRDRAPWRSVAPPDDPDGARPAGDDPDRRGASGAAQTEETRLIDRLVARDEAAFNALVRTYERRVFALIVRMIGNRAEAEDLAQEVFVQVFKAIGSFRGESKLSTWIYRIAINLSKNRSKYLRVRHSAQQEELASLEERGPLAQGRRPAANSIERPDDLAAGRQLENIVQEAILALEPSFRECLVLRDIEDLSYEEIGKITRLPEGTVKSRIHRARAQLKELVELALGEKIP